MQSRLMKFIVPDTHNDLEKLDRKLRITKMGTKAGKENRPATTATEPDANERSIEQAFRKMFHDTTAWFSRQLKREQDQQVQYTELWDPGCFTDCCETAEQALA